MSQKGRWRDKWWFGILVMTTMPLLLVFSVVWTIGGVMVAHEDYNAFWACGLIGGPILMLLIFMPLVFRALSPDPKE